MAQLSIGRVWQETWRVLRAESALLAPVALATIGAAMLLLTQILPDPVGNQLPRGPWLLWLFPIYALILTGIIAMSALVLRGGTSVADSLRLALRRLPLAATMVLGMAALSVLASVPVAVATLIDARTSGGPGPLAAIANGAMLAVTVWLWVRLLPMWAVVTDGRPTPMAVFRDSFALTRGLAGRLLGLTLVALAAAVVIGAAVLFGGGALLLTIGRAIGGMELASLLVALLMSVLIAAAVTIWTVLVAILYRHLRAARSA